MRYDQFLVVFLKSEVCFWQVNADIRRYILKENGERVLAQVNTTHVGKSISTKAVGSSNVHIVTNDYKFREGSESERATLLGGYPSLSSSLLAVSSTCSL